MARTAATADTATPVIMAVTSTTVDFELTATTASAVATETAAPVCRVASGAKLGQNWAMDASDGKLYIVSRTRYTIRVWTYRTSEGYLRDTTGYGTLRIASQFLGFRNADLPLTLLKFRAAQMQYLRY